MVLYDTATAQPLHAPLDIHMMYAYAWRPDEGCLAYMPTPSAADAPMKIMDLSSGSLAPLLAGHREFDHPLAWSPNGDFLACFSRKGIRIWQVESQKVQVQSSAGRHHWRFDAGVSFSANSGFVVISDFALTQVWDLESRTCIKVFCPPQTRFEVCSVSAWPSQEVGSSERYQDFANCCLPKLAEWQGSPCVAIGTWNRTGGAFSVSARDMTRLCVFSPQCTD